MAQIEQRSTSSKACYGGRMMVIISPCYTPKGKERYLADLDRDVLNQIFSAFPHDQRIGFLKKAFESLDQEARERLLSQWVHTPPTVPVESHIPINQRVNQPTESPQLKNAKPLIQPEDPQSRIAAELKKFQFHQEQEQRNQKRRMPLQLLGCTLIGLLVIGLLLGLSVGAKELWDLLRSLIMP